MLLRISERHFEVVRICFDKAAAAVLLLNDSNFAAAARTLPNLLTTTLNFQVTVAFLKTVDAKSP